MKTIFTFLPGIIISVLVALCGIMLSSVVPNELISGGVFALLVGMAFHPLTKRIPITMVGINFTGKKLLKIAIIGMGVSLHISQVVHIGAISLIVMSFTLFTAFAGGYALGEFLKIPWRQSGLISAGTGICGGSAIAAIAPVIDADHQDIAYALSATFLFDIAMVILFPLVGKAMGMSDFGFGLWTGTAVNDTSSVVAAGFSFSEAAGNYAIVVKLTRTLSIIPAILIFSYIHLKSRNKDTKQHSYSLLAIFPWFIILFLIVVLLNSLNLFSENLQISISSIGKFCMVMALGAIGLKTDFFSLITSGFRPMLLGFLVSIAVVVVSFLVQLLLHQV